MTKFLTEEEIRKLNSERTQGEWFSDHGKIGCNDFGIGEMDESVDGNFVAAAPQITKQYLELVQKVHQLEIENQIYKKAKHRSEIARANVAKRRRHQLSRKLEEDITKFLRDNIANDSYFYTPDTVIAKQFIAFIGRDKFPFKERTIYDHVRKVRNNHIIVEE